MVRGTFERERFRAFRAAGVTRLSLGVQAFDDEVLDENNSAEREINVRDESLKLLFVEYEPTWEWRFVKEVFHRDPLIGWEGFRTFLRSADFKVRQTNDLFLETLTAERLSDHFVFRGTRLPESIGTGLQRNIYHYWFHTGEAHAIRQMLGHRDLPEFVGDMSAAEYRRE